MIFLADRPSDWRTALEEGLRTDALQVEVSASGAALHDQLASPKHRVIVVGTELEGPSGLDTLFQLRATRPRTDVHVVLVTDARADHELLQLLTTRGIAGFLYRDEPIEKTVEKILALIHSQARAHPRVMVELPAKLEVRGLSLGARVDNVSAGGAQASVAARLLPDGLSMGERIRITLEVDDGTFTTEAEVRRCVRQKKLLGDRLILGLRFLFQDASQSARLQEVLEGARSPVIPAAPF